MPLLTEEELKTFPEPTTADVIPHYIARYWDLYAMADKTPAKVIGPDAKLRDRPGFAVDFLTRGSAQTTPAAAPFPTVLMPVTGHWRVTWDGGAATLAPGDTMSVPEHTPYTAEPSTTGYAGLYRTVATGDKAGPTWKG